jgi:bifunctional non-homologous end joining protein LigD
MSLKTYNKKRDFKITPEPKGKTERTKKSSLRYLIQKHDASRLHYDFRLELNGVLLSWAVPKGPSLDPARKALAVHVEDHPIAYGDFEGTIPEGEYGGGTVMLWDRGTWEPLGDQVEEYYKKGRLHFILHGEKLHGEWSLIQMHGPRSEDGKNWLLMKLKDKYATDKGDILVDKPLSVKTGRDLDEIAADKKAVWKSNRSKDDDDDNGGGGKTRSAKKAPAASTNAVASKRGTAKAARSSGSSRGGAKRRAAADVAALTGAVKSALPAHLSPQLAVLAERPPQGEEWVHEIKFDGYRILAHVRDGKVRMMTRNGHDWTDKFKPIATALEKLNIESAILDGEIVVLDAEGRSDFQALQAMLKDREKVELSYYVFDLPYCNGYDLTDTPLVERKAALEEILATSRLGPRINYSEHMTGDGSAVFNQACSMSLEGIISKLANGRYASRRDPSWLKSKCDQRQEFVIIGWSDPQGGRAGFGSLLLGYHDDQKRLVYAGRVGTGFDDRMLRDMHKQMQSLAIDKPPTDIDPPARERRQAHWIKPQLVGEVRFTGWTRDGVLRHPAFIALRSDKPATQIVREQAMNPAKVKEKKIGTRTSAAVMTETPAKGKKAATTTAKAPVNPAKSANSAAAAKPASVAKSEGDGEVAGVRLSHPNKVLYPEQGVSKLDVAEYYQAAEKWMLPHVTNRPLALVRCPNGRGSKCFFQRNWSDTMPKAVGKVDVSDSKAKEEHVAVHDLAGIISLVQMGVLEIHTWNCSGDDIEHPDQLVFDLDPGPDVAWKRVVEGARILNKTLSTLRLPQFLKTSGGKGLHITIPIEPTIDWDSAKRFCETIVKSLAEENNLFVANMRKDLRGGKIYIDYHRNGRGATAVAPYSTRAREGAPVSMPISWEELGKLSSASHFTVETARRYLEKRKTDPWRDFAKSRVDVRKIVGTLKSAA